MKSRGFTLIEVLIAVGVIGILSAIALPIYWGYVAKAEAASVTVAGLGSNFQAQLDQVDGTGSTSGTGAGGAPSTGLTTSTGIAASNPTSIDNGNSGNENSNAATPPSQPTGSSAEATPANPATSGTGGGSSTTSQPTTNSSGGTGTASTSTSGSSGSGGGSAAPKSPIVPPETFASCVSNTCKLKAGSSHDMSFNVQAVDKVKKEDIKVVATADAKADDVSFDAKTGIVSLELTAPKKDKDFTLTLNAGKERIVLNFTTKGA